MTAMQGTAPVSGPPEETVFRRARTEPGTDFLDLLAQTTARTAQAEGPETRPDGRPEQTDAEPGTTGAGNAETGAEEAVVSAPATPVAVPIVAPPQPAGEGLVDAQSAAAAPTSTLPAAGEVAVPPPAEPVAPADPEPAIPMGGVAVQLDAVAGETEVDDRAGTGAQPPVAEPRPKADAPVVPPTPSQAVQARPGPERQDARESQDAPAPTPALDAKAASPASRDAVAPDPSATSPGAASAERAGAAAEDRTAANAPAPAARPADLVRPAEPVRPAPVRAVPLSRAAETVDATLRIAAQRGGTLARLQLSPAELGHVEVSLRATADGVVATVRADAAEAAGVLQQAGADLRRSLESAGVRVLQLDIGWNGTESRGDTDLGRSGRGPSGPDAGASGAPEPELPETVLELPNGVLVDVIA